MRCHSMSHGQIHRANVKNKFAYFLSLTANLKVRKIDFSNHLPYFPPKFSADKKQDGGLTNYVLTPSQLTELTVLTAGGPVRGSVCELRVPNLWGGGEGELT